MPRLLPIALLAAAFGLGGCLAAAATGAVVGTAGAVVVGGAKATGAVVGAGVDAVTESDKERKKKERKRRKREEREEREHRKKDREGR